MAQPVPSVVDRTKRWIKLLTRRSRTPSGRSNDITNTGFFASAQDFTVNGGNFINEMKVNYIQDVVVNKQAVFELLEPYACPGATKDSSARYPPPSCHPETRLKIRESLMQWLSNEYDDWKMMWVRGSAGTGKSAVAQSFGDACAEDNKHGASYFFSRTAGRNKLETVVPTLVCQLAMTVPEYRSLIGRELANNPFLLQQSPPVQFRELILGPFATLQRQRYLQPVVIILDGLDECEGENAQQEILAMIANAVQKNPDLPLRWLIFSRPEAHLKNAFMQYACCGREELTIDAECREDVERYVKDRFTEMNGSYKDVLPAEWPPQDELQQLLDAVAGLFVLASTCLNFIADPDEADPPSQLNSLLTFLRRSQGVVSRNPLAALDLLYSQILEKIPPGVYDTTRQILSFMSHRDKLGRGKKLSSAQALSNFLRLDQHTFYKAARGLYSVMSIPDLEDAAKCQLQFYHASFQDFLLDPIRSGKFSIDEQEALLIFVQLGIYWYEVDVMYFHRNEGWQFDRNHNHDTLPGLTWASQDNESLVSRSIVTLLRFHLFRSLGVQLNVVTESLLSQVQDVDFRYWQHVKVLSLAHLCRLTPSNSFVRVEPSSPMDYRLLEYLDIMIKNGIAKPAVFPLRIDFPDNEWIREYFIIGRGVRSVIVWRTKSPTSSLRYPHCLRCDQEPSDAQISLYQNYLKEIEWDEVKARAEMQ